MRLIDLGLAVAAIRAGQKCERKTRDGVGTIFFWMATVRPICANAAGGGKHMTAARQTAVLIFLEYIYDSHSRIHPVTIIGTVANSARAARAARCQGSSISHDNCCVTAQGLLAARG